MEASKELETSEQAKSRHIGWVFWLKWTLANALGFATGSIASFFLLIFNRTLFQAISALALFTCLGTMQWIVLRHRISHAGWWIPATVCGWILPVYIGFNSLGADVGYALDMALIGGLGHIADRGVQGAFAGFGVGLLQWAVLRRHVPRAHWWILTTTASVFLCGLLEPALTSAGVQLGFPFFMALFGTIFGATTGIPLVYLLERRDLWGHP